jgi:hypothetical protein
MRRSETLVGYFRFPISLEPIYFYSNVIDSLILELLFLGNLGYTYFINVKFNEISENIINQGAIGARNDANPGAIKAITLVEQHTTPLARADAPAIAVDVEDAAEVILLEESEGVETSLISQYGFVTINPP